MSKQIQHRNANVIEAVQEETSPYWRKILVHLGTNVIEDIRWNKVVHIRQLRRLPKIHKDGRVTIRHLGNDIDVRAEYHYWTTENGTHRGYYSFHLAD